MGESTVNLYAAGDHTFYLFYRKEQKAIASYCELNSHSMRGRFRRLPGCGPTYDFSMPGSNSSDALAEIGSGSTEYFVQFATSQFVWISVIQTDPTVG